ncbi:putative oxidoreductase YuxG [Frankliniella fusca]|uniref:Oxidoreductase YuxG n=1 Tax=Frankliniella fusca TaxID=407009 RepID=A0AAE1LUF1_9NEOP|nr:putative oxidoreductase YuxG [Frankliniella fusca]
MAGLQKHLKGVEHIPPYDCGEAHCYTSFLDRRSLYRHLRDHHKTTSSSASSPSSPNLLPSSSRMLPEELVYHYPEGALSASDVQMSVSHVCDEEPLESAPVSNESEQEAASDCSLETAAEHAVLRMRSVTYMTSVAIEAVNEQCFNLMQDTATILKHKVLNFISLPEKDRNLDQLLKEFSINNPFVMFKTKTQQLACFQKKYGLLLPREVYLGQRFDSRQNPKRPRLQPTQKPRSYQYVSIRDILRGVLSDPCLRKLILSEKPSPDEFMRTFRDGALFKTLPPDLKDAIRIILYIDDLEVLQALSSRAGAYKISGTYFGIQNLPPELNSLLNYIFVTALAYADDATHSEVWELFLTDMQKLETEGIDIMIDEETVNFKAVLIAQIGDTLAAHELLGFVSPSCQVFCRCCYISRKDMWIDGLKKGEARTPQKHELDIRGCNNVVIRKTTGVRGPPLLHGLRFFHCVQSSVFDIFHDLQQGVCKMEIKLALREYVCKSKYLTDEELNSRIKYFDYGFVEKKNKPSPNFTARYLNDIKSYNLHQTGAQMWCLVRVFPFLLGDLVPADDKFFHLISLLNQIMTIVFAHAISEYELKSLDLLIHKHHTLFQEIFPCLPEGAATAMQEEEIQIQVELEDSFENPDNPQVVELGTCGNPAIVGEVAEQDSEEELELPEEDFINEEVAPYDEDVEVVNQAAATEEDSTTKMKNKKGPKVVRLINKHHHMLHYSKFMRNFGPLILYWCIRYEAKHYFFKLCATVCHNFQNVLKTLMEVLQMKIVADRLKSSSHLTMGKRGRKHLYVSESPHREQLFAYGLIPSQKVYKVKSVVCNGVDYRPDLFVTLKLRTQYALPVFASIKAVYVSDCEKHIYLLVQEWYTVEFDALYCAYHVTPLPQNAITVKEANMFASYRLLSSWTRYNSENVYLAPRTVS